MKKEAAPMSSEISADIAENTPNLMIESRIKTIRGVQVLLSRDLAELYQVEPRAINQAVKRNQERFPEKYCFQLTPLEFNDWKSQIVISKSDEKGLRHAPYAFTEQGVAMLSAVLKSERAIRVSIEIMDAFVLMRHYLREHQEFLDTPGYIIAQMSLLNSQNAKDIATLSDKLEENCKKTDLIQSDLQKIMENFTDPATFKHFVILDGRKFEADIAYTQIYGMAKHSIIVIDNYLDVKTLDLLRCVADGVKVTILSDQYGGCRLTPLMKADFEAVRPGVLQGVKPAKNRFHDRYIVLDFGTESEKMYHCGASSKDAGGKITTIMEIENPEVYRKVIEELL